MHKKLSISYHGEIYLEENIALRVDDNDYRIYVDRADYRNSDNKLYEIEMTILAEFVRKYNLNVIYDSHERKINEYTRMITNKREEIYFFKNKLLNG